MAIQEQLGKLEIIPRSKSSSLMENTMKVTLKTTAVMGKESTTIPMETIMMESGKTIRGLVEAVSFKLTVQNSMVSSSKMQLMVKSSTKTKMETSFRPKPHLKRIRLKKRKI